MLFRNAQIFDLLCSQSFLLCFQLCCSRNDIHVHNIMNENAEESQETQCVYMYHFHQLNECLALVILKHD